MRITQTIGTAGVLTRVGRGEPGPHAPHIKINRDPCYFASGQPPASSGRNACSAGTEPTSL